MKHIFKFSKLPNCIKHRFESQAEENSKEKVAEIGSIEEHELLVYKDQDTNVSKHCLRTRESQLEIVDAASKDTNEVQEDYREINFTDVQLQKRNETTAFLRSTSNKNAQKNSQEIDKLETVTLDME